MTYQLLKPQNAILSLTLSVFTLLFSTAASASLNCYIIDSSGKMVSLGFICDTLVSTEGQTPPAPTAPVQREVPTTPGQTLPSINDNIPPLPTPTTPSNTNPRGTVPRL